LGLDYFWLLTPKQYAKHAQMFIQMREINIRQQDQLNHILGSYIRVAFNDPSKYPGKPYLHKEETATDQTASDMERIARLNTLTLGGEINYAGNND